jgi:hypothetical protein
VGVTGAAGWQGWLGLDRLGREVRGEGEGDAGVGVGEDAVGWDRRRLWEWRIRFGCSQSLVVHSSVCLSVCLSGESESVSVWTSSSLGELALA